MYDVEEGVSGDEGVEDGDEGEAGWNVGLWDGAWSGLLGRREIGGEWITSDWKGLSGRLAESQVYGRSRLTSDSPS